MKLENSIIPYAYYNILISIKVDPHCSINKNVNDFISSFVYR